ncbi:MAG: hypothetical protein LBS71_02320 [Puniceicoccales bacterium]|nr:hypothetical protein [Puniceicoccales bacterium]
MKEKKVKIDLEEPLEESLEEDFEEKEIDIKKKKIIQQSTVSKALPNDPWQLVAHTNLNARKVTVGTKAKNKVKVMQVTSLKKFSKMPNDLKVKHIPLAKRKAVQVDLNNGTLLQIIKKVLKDYNSISFLTQVKE